MASATATDLRVWKLRGTELENNFSLVQIFELNSETLTCISLHDNLLALGLSNGNVQVRDLKASPLPMPKKATGRFAFLKIPLPNKVSSRDEPPVINYYFIIFVVCRGLKNGVLGKYFTFGKRQRARTRFLISENAFLSNP